MQKGKLYIPSYVCVFVYEMNGLSDLLKAPRKPRLNDYDYYTIQQPWRSSYSILILDVT